MMGMMAAKAACVLLLLAALCASSSFAQEHWWEAIMPTFREVPTCSKSELCSKNTGLSSVKGYVAATGDFNGDKFTDLFIVKDTEQQVQVYLFYEGDFTFKQLDSASISVPSIMNVAAGDFNYDGKLDCIITGMENGKIFMNLYTGDLERLKFERNIVEDTEEPADQVLVMDANNDLLPDLFGTSKASGDRTFWINPGTGAWKSQPAPTTGMPIASPNSNAFVDINGDCLADLLVVAQDPDSGVNSLEIWLNEKKSGYQLDQVFELVPGAGQLTFADFNADGTIDISFPVCYPAPACTTENSVHIIYNEQKEVCSGLWSTDCRSPSNLCDNTEYTLPEMNNSNQSEDVVILDSFEEGDGDDDTGVLWADNSLSPLTVRAGDYNLDGYADLLIPIFTTSGSHIVQLWENVECDKNSNCSTDAVKADRRTFKRVTKGVSQLTKVTTAYTATFLDIGELGVFDILLLADDGVRGGASVKSIRTLINGFYNDAYFIKMLGLNGRCPSWCRNDENKFPDPKPYGVNQPGGVFKFTVTDAAGKKRGAVGNQLTQSSFMSLQTPYAFLGLGRTSNYIDSMFYGVPLNDSVHFHQYQGVIPNSQVAAFPYPTDKPASWTMEMYITPSGILFWVIILCIVVCILFALCVAYFTYRERQEDKEEEREKGFSFNPL